MVYHFSLFRRLVVVVFNFQKNNQIRGCFQSKDTPAPDTTSRQPTSFPPASADRISEGFDGNAANSANATTNESSASATSKTAAASAGTKGNIQEIAVKKVDPKDFMFSNQKNTTLIKEPGTVNGQMFIIEDSEDCDMYVCDRTATVTVDYCTNCRIFIGPSQGSVFVRNCTGCHFIIACQQFRSRDCKDCDILLFSQTAPVIEESKNIRFGCFRFAYFNLKQQFDMAKMSVWDNKWSEIYDFTPTESNYTFLPPETTSKDVLKPLNDVTSAFKSEPEMRDDEVVPLTWGRRPKPSHPSCFVLGHPGKDDNLKDLLAALPKEIVVIQTCVVKLDKNKATVLFSKEPSQVEKFSKGEGCVAIELNGPEVLSVAKELAEKTIPDSCHVSSSADSAQHELQVCFEQWKESAGRPMH